MYSINPSLQDKLNAIQVTGPHTLHLITNEDLRTEGKLSVGELATIRDAEIRWRQDLLNHV
jgi:hypothetical protein